MSKTILFLDTETTGLPQNWKSPYDQWPRMVSIAMWLADDDKNEWLVKPNGWSIPEEASKIHGITNQKALDNGYPIEFILCELQVIIESVDLVVFHNSSFDTGIISGEQMRLGYSPENLICHQYSKIFCTKERSTNILKIPNGRGGYKWPSLAELCAFCGVENKGAHNALNDVIATKECYFYMVERGFF